MGEVYHRTYRSAQPARRLEEYVRYPLFRTVGIDSAFYEPPSEQVLAAYARALPPGFPCVSKVWDRITARRFTQDPRWGNLAGQRNPSGGPAITPARSYSSSGRCGERISPSRLGGRRSSTAS